MNIENLTLEEMVDLRNRLNWAIEDYDDGYEYHCYLSSYGSRRTYKYKNVKAAQDLCHEYYGDNGIVTIYTTNPDAQIDNYGSTYYFPTIADAEAWRNYDYVEKNLPEWQMAWSEWENRDNIPFNHRPHFAPYVSQEEIEHYKNFLAENKDIIKPKSLSYIHES